MPLARLFYLAGLRIDSTYLSHVASQSVDNALEDITVYPAGHGFPRFTGSKSWSPEIPVETTDLAGAIGLLANATICADLSSVNVDLLYREAEASGIHSNVATTSLHQVYRGQSNAFLYWESLSANQDDDAASFAMRVLLQDAGGSDPVQVPAVALPAAGLQTAPWTLGPWSINGAPIGSVTSARIDMNPEIERLAADGEATPTFVAIRRLRPVITIETANLRAVSALAREGFPVTTLTGYFRRRRPNRLLYAAGDAQHVRFAAAVGGSPPAGDAVGTGKWRETSGDPASARLEIALQESASGANLFALESGQTIS